MIISYTKSTPDLITELCRTAPVQRLKNIGMNCGCEYTKWPLFANLFPYSRFDHSLGCALITWHFTQDIRQTGASLFHDISTPCFAHSIDFMLGDYINQEATEEKTLQIIESCPETVSLLSSAGLTPADISDYHLFPVADAPSPHLCADRLEYSCVNMVNYGICSASEAQMLYNNTALAVNEDGVEEIAFSTPSTAYTFAQNALKCSYVYSCDTDRYTMQILAELIQKATDEKLFDFADLFTLTEPQLIEILSSNSRFSALWEQFRSISGTKSVDGQTSPAAGELPVRRIKVKKRLIDPLIISEGRVSAVFPSFAQDVQSFMEEKQDNFIQGLT